VRPSGKSYKGPTVQRQRPTRSDLIRIIGHLQTAIGNGISSYDNDRGQRAENVHAALEPAFDYAIEAGAFDPQPRGKSKNGWNGPVAR
jgi:hypothetical protein